MLARVLNKFAFCRVSMLLVIVMQLLERHAITVTVIDTGDA